MRVHELAKELEKTSKEIIEIANEKLGLSLKSHSSTITESQIQKIKNLYSGKSTNSAKPKAFVVKKQKAQETPEVKQEVKEDVVKKSVSRLEIVRSAKSIESQRPKQHQNNKKTAERAYPLRCFQMKKKKFIKRRFLPISVILHYVCVTK